MVHRMTQLSRIFKILKSNGIPASWGELIKANNT